MNDLMNTFDLLMKITPTTNRMDLIQFGSFHCLLLEEWCKHNGYDAQEVADHLRECITSVYDKKGRY